MTYLKRFWNWLLSKTTVDEKIIKTVEETKERIGTIKEEIQDVKAAAKEVVKQSKDVVEAAKGQKRQGLPKKKTTKK